MTGGSPLLWRWLAAGGAALAAIVVAPFIGPALSAPYEDFVLWQLRVPRVIVGASVGATLAVVGAAYQAVFQNALATPSTVGTTAGATFGVLAALAFPLPPGASAFPWLTGAAFVGGLATSGVVVGAAGRGRARSSDVLLVGIAATLLAGGGATALQDILDQQSLFVATQWSLGRLPQVGYDGVTFVAPFVLVCTLAIIALARPLQVIVLGSDAAELRGVEVRRVRALVLALGALAVAACVAWCGPIAFVGLIVPHLVRLTLGAPLRYVLPASALLGAAFLVVCDAIARTVFDGTELPVGVVTALVGAPILVLLVRRQSRLPG